MNNFGQAMCALSTFNKTSWSVFTLIRKILSFVTHTQTILADVFRCRFLFHLFPVKHGNFSCIAELRVVYTELYRQSHFPANRSGRKYSNEIVVQFC
jgi:hypothetical protein